MRALVIDASAFVKLLVDEPGSDRVEELESEVQLVAPDHLMLETANVLWKKVRWGGMPAEDALETLEVASRLDVELIRSSDLLEEALAIACELPQPLSDTLYLLLALHGGRALVTADDRMREAAEGLGVRVEWVGAEAPQESRRG